MTRTLLIASYGLLAVFSPLSSAFSSCNTHLSSVSTQAFTLLDLNVLPEGQESSSDSSGHVQTGDEVRIEFKVGTTRPVNQPEATLIISLLDVEIERVNVDLCAEMSCPISANTVLRGSFTHELSENIPEGIDIKARLLFTDETSTPTCGEESFLISDNLSEKAHLSARFGMDSEEIDFIMEKWFNQHEESVFFPDNENIYLSTGHGYAPKLGDRAALDARKSIFVENLYKIAQHNARKTSTYTMGLNQFAHLTPKEFKRVYASGYEPNLSYHLSSLPKTTHESTSFRIQRSLRAQDKPTEVNWVTAGAVTQVKNQGACGSCWSFATTGALEGAYFLKSGSLVSLSEQELVACDHVDLGCNGGAMDNGFAFAAEHSGLCSEESYPYSAGQGVRGFCSIENSTKTCDLIKAVPKKVVDVQHDEMDLLDAVAQQPVAVAIEADEQAFQFYSGGVLTAQCSQKLDHGVLLVGFGVETVVDETTGESADVDYWLIKNSWGSMWGLEGYIKIERGVEQEEGGECGVLLGPSYPVL